MKKNSWYRPLLFLSLFVPIPVSAQNNSCEKKYSRMFADGVLNITIANGYYESEGTVSDSVSGEIWFNRAVQALTGDCPVSFGLNGTENHLGTEKERNQAKKDRQASGCGQKKTYQWACGFKTSDEPEILIKTIMVKGKPSLIKLRIFTSALSQSDKYNKDSRERFIISKFCPRAIGTEKEACLKKNLPIKFTAAQLETYCQARDRFLFQECKSHYARKTWKEAITSGDEMVMYIGHVRDGGGPSFEPPRVLANGHVDYPWYRDRKEGQKEEAEAFREAVKKGKAPVLYSSLSCNGHLHFYKKGKFPEVSPSTGFVLSQRTTFADEGLAALLTTIEGALTKQCGEELSQKLQQASCSFGLYNF